MRSVSKITFFPIMSMQVTAHLSDPGWGLEPPWRPEARRRCFLALMVDALGSTALAPNMGPVVDVY
jgi:hypothetical protein